MAWERKLIRTVRIRNSQKTGVLARLLTAIAEAGGNTGSLVLLTETSQNVVRDITISAENEAHLETILEAMRKNEGTQIIEVRDEVLELHQKGKIAIRSRYPIRSLTTLRRVYTPALPKSASRSPKTRRRRACTPASATWSPSSQTEPPCLGSAISVRWQGCPSWKAKPC